MTGGHLTKVACPEGIEDFEGKKKEFTLHFSVWIVGGKVVSATRTYREDDPDPWVEKFEASCTEALKQWKFSKVWTKKGEMKEGWGMTLHVTFQNNKDGQCNTTIDQRPSRVYLQTNPTFIKDKDSE